MRVVVLRVTGGIDTYKYFILLKQVNEVFTLSKKSMKIYRPDKPNALFKHLDISKTISELGYAPKYIYFDWLKDFFKEEEKKQSF